MIKEMREKAAGEKQKQVIEKAQDAQNAYNTAKAHMEKTKRALSIVKD